MALPHGHGLTLITNSIPIAGVLTNHSDGFVHAVGGRVRGLTQATVGADTVAAIARLREYRRRSSAPTRSPRATASLGTILRAPSNARWCRLRIRLWCLQIHQNGREDLVLRLLDEGRRSHHRLDGPSPTDAAELADHGIGLFSHRRTRHSAHFDIVTLTANPSLDPPLGAGRLQRGEVQRAAAPAPNRAAKGRQRLAG